MSSNCVLKFHSINTSTFLAYLYGGGLERCNDQAFVLWFQVRKMILAQLMRFNETSLGATYVSGKRVSAQLTFNDAVQTEVRLAKV